MLATQTTKMHRGRFYAVTLTLAMVFTGVQAQQPSADPDAALAAADLSDIISNQGPRAAVDSLLASPGRRDWQYVMRRMETGSGEWLSLAPDLLPGVTSDAAAELRRSLAYALSRQPSLTLRLVNADINIDYLCTAPVSVGDPAERRKYIRNTLHALSAVADPELQDHRAFCAEALQQIQHLMPLNPAARR